MSIERTSPGTSVKMDARTSTGAILAPPFPETAMGKMELDLTSYWVPFTPNRHFKSAPRILVSAKDMHYTTDDGR